MRQLGPMAAHGQPALSGPGWAAGEHPEEVAWSHAQGLWPLPLRWRDHAAHPEPPHHDKGPAAPGPALGDSRATEQPQPTVRGPRGRDRPVLFVLFGRKPRGAASRGRSRGGASGCGIVWNSAGETCLLRAHRSVRVFLRQRPLMHIHCAPTACSFLLLLSSLGRGGLSRSALSPRGRPQPRVCVSVRV